MKALQMLPRIDYNRFFGLLPCGFCHVSDEFTAKNRCFTGWNHHSSMRDIAILGSMGSQVCPEEKKGKIK